jgi:hypothetical protein
MPSDRAEQLAAAVALMPDGPSRERFTAVLSQLQAADAAADSTEQGGAGEHGYAYVDDGPELLEDPTGLPDDDVGWAGDGQVADLLTDPSALDLDPAATLASAPDAPPDAGEAEKSKRRWRRKS